MTTDKCPYCESNKKKKRSGFRKSDGKYIWKCQHPWHNEK